MTLATRRQILTGAAGGALAASGSSILLRAQTPAVAPSVSDAEINISVFDASVGSKDRSALVPVTLSTPTNRTIVIEYSTENGNDTYGVLPGHAPGGAHFVIARGRLIFQPGEQNKLVEVQLLRPLKSGQSIILKIGDFLDYPSQTYVSKIGRITSTNGSSVSSRFSNDSIPLPAVPTGGSIVFSDNLLGADLASDSGLLPDGRPCWQSRPSHGRRQDGNKELGYYADPALNPEATVWGIDASTGRRFIQAEYLENGLSDRKGGKLSLSWREDIPFSYSAAMVTSRTLFNRITLGSYVEFEVKLTKVAGSWPGLWLKQANGAWPPEIDILECFIKSSSYPSDVNTSSIHWQGAKGHQTYGASVPLSDFEPGADIFSRFNRFGCYLGERQIVYYFNDRPYCAMPNLVGAGPWYMLMQVAVGGAVGQPSDPKAFPVRMYIANVKVVQIS